MADIQTQPTKASVATFLNSIADSTRRADGKALAKIMQKVTGQKPVMWGPAIVGFGRCHYKYASGRAGEMPLASFSPRKAATVLYVSMRSTEAKSLLGKLGKHKVGGKSCLYVPKLADVNKEVLARLIVRSAETIRAKYPD
ncbi:MAG TPA: DUF1801 domain-containing protein [Terriglobales bacterium]|nr:DUF1801 domain-containing protein [Terriglobales bacterium]